MYVEDGVAAGEAVSQERRSKRQPDARMLGRVVECDGAAAVVASYAEQSDTAPTEHWCVGRLVSISTGQTRMVGLVSQIEMPNVHWDEQDRNPIKVHLELIGEVRDDEHTRAPYFDRGITVYPHIGAVAHRIRARDLAAVYHQEGKRTVPIGTLSQDASIPARISVDAMLHRHFAIVGTTGVGKSTAVSLLLHKAVEERPDLRVLILDPHNEFASAFNGLAQKMDLSGLELPFWLFTLDELAEVLFRGRDNVVDELDILRDLIPVAKVNYRTPSGAARLRRSSDMGAVTADTPVPYRVADLIRLIDERMGMLDAKSERPALKTLRARLDSVINDPSYRFMFGPHVTEETIHQALGRIFRVPHEGRPVLCFQMAGMPSEVVNSVCSVLARLAFDIAQASEGKLKLLILCEEAHRYMPSDHRLGFAPTRHALARIAKEGRKYGCFLGVVTQRPGELDPTILSQCSTVFAMRLANDRDHDIIRSAIADSSASVLAFLSSMGQRETIAFGEAVATPMRLKFEQLGQDMIPGLDIRDELGKAEPNGEIDLAALIGRIRHMKAPGPAENDEDPAFFGEQNSILKRSPSGIGAMQKATYELPQHLNRRTGDPLYRPVGE
ncbi:ATP-binding protein [Mesorhizobium xinjiangense]|uniref:ATP-binding protein n=1 Tax=Mesorhizobium xinjiangense TaxID=2678685 RepID=UPI0012EDA0E7|nr:ATP-binding protein [Mesorhizobium xinjiangense]